MKNLVALCFTGVYPGFTQREWFLKIYPFLTDADKPIECIQEPGEILYLVNLSCAGLLVLYKLIYVLSMSWVLQ